MPIPGVPKGLRRQVRDAFVAALKSDPRLANGRAVKTWLTWDGGPAIADVSVDQMPACQVRMLGGPVRRLAGTRAPGRPMTHVDEASPTMLVEVWTPGTDQGDLADVADLIHGALAPQDPLARAQLQERFRAAGIKDWRLAREIGPTSAESFAQEGVMGQGSYELTVQFFS